MKHWSDQYMTEPKRVSLYLEQNGNGQVQVWASSINEEHIIGQWDNADMAVYEASKIYPNAHMYDAHGQLLSN